jgi:hypothetical protein
MELTHSRERVVRRSPRHVNESIRARAEERITRAAEAGPHALDARIAELDREWDIERAVEANAATLALAGLGLGLLVNRRFLALPVVVAGFLLQHAVQGWCPPVSILRRLGFRTVPEIDHERYALKALRGDFCAIRPWRPEGARTAFDAAR